MDKQRQLLAALIVLSAFLAVSLATSLWCMYNRNKALEPSFPAATLSAYVPFLAAADRPGPLYGDMLPLDSIGPEGFQNPSYPTGCEAVAAAVMLRLNGSAVTNEQVVAAMPRSEDDFVNAYVGDPSDMSGFTIMAPGIRETCRLLSPSGYAPIDLTGTELTGVPVPSVIWVTRDFAEPLPTKYEREGSTAMLNTHCVVLLSCDEAQVHVWDPLQGYRDVAFSVANDVYNKCGRQAVYCAPRGYKQRS